MFAHIPEEEIAEIVSTLRERAAAAALSLEDALVGMMTMWGTASVTVLLQLELRLLEFADLLSKGSFAAVRSRLPAITSGMGDS
jgi:hypothetical protein